MISLIERPTEALSLLISHGADINIATQKGETVLHEVAKTGREDCLLGCLENHANINAETEAGETPLHWAAAYGTYEMVQMLLQRGANVNATTRTGETPLDWAFQNINHEVKDILIEHGAGIGQRNPTPELITTTATDTEHCPGTAIWGVLIGINEYSTYKKIKSDGNSSQNTLQDLRGCVNDILLAEKYLHNDLKVQPSHIKRLITGVSGKNNSPTYRNIIEALESTAAAAAPGDSVYIHYSGHGGRKATLFPVLKGRGSSDACLVPVDAFGDGQVLRDLEFEYFLRKMVDKGLAVTVVLDCLNYIDDGSREYKGNDMDLSAQKIPIYSKEIMDLFDPESPHNQGKLLAFQPKLYTIFTDTDACELSIKGKRHGALSYHLLELVRKRFVTGLSCQTIHRHLQDSGARKFTIIGETQHPFLCNRTSEYRVRAESARSVICR